MGNFENATLETSVAQSTNNYEGFQNFEASSFSNQNFPQSQNFSGHSLEAQNFAINFLNGDIPVAFESPPIDYENSYIDYAQPRIEIPDFGGDYFVTPTSNWFNTEYAETILDNNTEEFITNPTVQITNEVEDLTAGVELNPVFEFFIPEIFLGDTEVPEENVFLGETQQSIEPKTEDSIGSRVVPEDESNKFAFEIPEISEVESPVVVNEIELESEIFTPESTQVQNPTIEDVGRVPKQENLNKYKFEIPEIEIHANPNKNLEEILEKNVHVQNKLGVELPVSPQIEIVKNQAQTKPETKPQVIQTKKSKIMVEEAEVESVDSLETESGNFEMIENFQSNIVIGDSSDPEQHDELSENLYEVYKDIIKFFKEEFFDRPLDERPPLNLLDIQISAGLEKAIEDGVLPENFMMYFAIDGFILFYGRGTDCEATYTSSTNQEVVLTGSSDLDELVTSRDYNYQLPLVAQDTHSFAINAEEEIASKAYHDPDKKDYKPKDFEDIHPDAELEIPDYVEPQIEY